VQASRAHDFRRHQACGASANDRNWFIHHGKYEKKFLLYVDHNLIEIARLVSIHPYSYHNAPHK
jgi:hypothetical protein